MKQRAGGPREGTGARDAAGEQRREQMLRAALDVIVERGYADTRIADVAERTGTSPALVIYYFKTRDQLLTEAIRYSEDTWYAEYLLRLETIPTAAGRLTELIGMNCLPGTDPEPHSYWLLWLDLWARWPRCGRSPTSGGGRPSAPSCWLARRPASSHRSTRTISPSRCPPCSTGLRYKSHWMTRRCRRNARTILRCGSRPGNLDSSPLPRTGGKASAVRSTQEVAPWPEEASSCPG
jgi:AcrR family transcriptional regulator